MNEDEMKRHPAKPWIPEAFRADGSVLDW